MTIDYKLAERVVALLNDMLEMDAPAVAALIANRVPCNTKLLNHPTVQVGVQHGGNHVGMLGVLNGLCGIDDVGFGGVVACFDEPKDERTGDQGWLDLTGFRVSRTIGTETPCSTD